MRRLPSASKSLLSRVRIFDQALTAKSCTALAGEDEGTYYRSPSTVREKAIEAVLGGLGESAPQIEHWVCGLLPAISLSHLCRRPQDPPPPPPPLCAAAKCTHKYPRPHPPPPPPPCPPHPHTYAFVRRQWPRPTLGSSPSAVCRAATPADRG